VVVVPVDYGQIDGRSCQSLGCREAAKACSDNHDLLPAGCHSTLPIDGPPIMWVAVLSIQERAGWHFELQGSHFRAFP
jgi:hypothetical protein